MPSYTLDPNPAFVVGATVKAYACGGEAYRNGEPPTAVAATAVVAADSRVTFDNLGYATRYWAAAQVGGVWRWVGFTTAALPAGETSIARKPLGTSLQYVDADNGTDTNDGLSWGTAKRTLAAARAAMPAGGRLNLAATVNEYQVASALDWGGYAVECVSRVSGLPAGMAVIRHKYNGNLFDFGAKGGFLRNLLLYEDDVTPGRTGAAIAATSSAAAGGFIQCENLVISGGDGWERDVVLDGSAWAVFGIRKCEFLNCQFFGARTAGEAIKITRGVHCKFLGGFLDPAPTAVAQGIKLIDVGTTDVQFSNFEVIGDFSTEAAGECTFMGRISGTATCQAGSDKNVFVGPVALFVNNGAPGAGNMVVAPGGITIGDVKLRRNAADEWAVDDRFIITRATGGLNALAVRIGNFNTITISADGTINFADGAGGANDLTVLRAAADLLALGTDDGLELGTNTGTGKSFLRLWEQSVDAAAAPGNAVHLFSRDNGAGKTQLCARFATGAVQVIATEP